MEWGKYSFYLGKLMYFSQQAPLVIFEFLNTRCLAFAEGHCWAFGKGQTTGVGLRAKPDKLIKHWRYNEPTFLLPNIENLTVDRPPPDEQIYINKKRIKPNYKHV